MEVMLMKRLVLSKKEICTIPNLLTLIRILLVPVYMTLLILGGKAEPVNMTYVYIALGIVLFAEITDVLDGKIARKFNQGSYVGQLIDPVADKCMHIGAIVALAITHWLHWAFIIFIVLRELAMIIVGSFVLNKVNVKANMLGKVASATISVGILLCFFHTYISKLWGDYGFDWIIVTIGLVLNWSAAINYAVGVVRDIKADKANAQENTQNDGSESVETEVVENAENEVIESVEDDTLQAQVASDTTESTND